MENVLFTTNVDDFIKFAQIKMSRKNILNFADELSNKYKYQFKINGLLHSIYIRLFNKVFARTFKN